MAIRAVLFDVGGPLDTEATSERLKDEDIKRALAAEGCPVSDAEFDAANLRAVESFAWNTYQAIIWNLAAPDLGRCERAYARVRERSASRDLFELREGIPGLLERLHARGLRLGLAANQPAAALDRLDRAGIGRRFHHREVSGVHGFHKPDPRLFLRACEDLGVRPDECVMVGDRVDNDIVPAKWLGMRAVLFRTGRHINQQPRSWRESPDREVRDVPGLEAALDALARDAR
jgi:putative hydrolase of the HAD superfamily